MKLCNVRPNLIPKLTVTTPDLVSLHFLQVGEHSGKELGDGEYVGNVAERDPNQLLYATAYPAELGIRPLG